VKEAKEKGTRRVEFVNSDISALKPKNRECANENGGGSSNIEM
jgi:hypothetical protein